LDEDFGKAADTDEEGKSKSKNNESEESEKDDFGGPADTNEGDWKLENKKKKLMKKHHKKMNKIKSEKGASDFVKPLE